MLASFALAAALATPTASPSPAPLKTIVTVRTSPYCSALAQHFNRIVVPMLANDRTLDSVSVSLEAVNTLFDKLDYVSRFTSERVRMENYVGALLDSLPEMQAQINQLRAAQALTTDPARSSEMHLLAQELQRAYDKQRQLSIDLLGVVHAMMDYDIMSAKRQTPMERLEALNSPADARDVKSYLRFNGQRDRLSDAESKAAGLALDIEENVCKR